jgi:hypothetical protein
MTERLPLMIGLFCESGQLSTLWNRCVADLSNYSRAISKPLATTQLRVNAWRALPAELRLPATNPVFDRFTQIIGRAQAFDGYRIMKVGLLAQLIGIARCERLSAAQGRRLSAAIQELGWRMAPDPTVSGGSPSWEQELALFQPLASDPSPQLPVLSGLLYLTAIVCGESLGGEQLDSPAGHRARARRSRLEIFARHGARAAPGSRDRPFFACQNCQGDCPRLQRKRSCRDIRSSPLERGYFRGTGSPSDKDRAGLRTRGVAVRAIVEKTLGSPGVVVLRKNSRAGESIPIRVEPFALDLARIDALSIETREVAALLSEIMMDDPVEAEKLEEPESLQPTTR